MPTYILFLGQLSKVTSLRIAPNIIFIKVSTTVLTKEEKLTRVNGYHMFYFITSPYVIRCAILYHLYNFTNVKNTHGGVLLLV